MNVPRSLNSVSRHENALRIVRRRPRDPSAVHATAASAARARA